MWLHTSILLALVYSRLALSTLGFAANPSINAKAILNAARNASSFIATFPTGSGSKSKIFNDWFKLHDVSALGFFADMDVDCDGVDFKCSGNPDGQPQTSFGHLRASKVPYYVIPDTFFNAHRAHIRPNALGAIICGGRMFYGIMADTNGDTPEVIGEASILLAQTCFPHEGLNGGNGHNRADVLYVVFGNQVPSGIGDKTIDIEALKRLGDKTARQLVKALHG